jgi:hypothetical protein
VSGAASKGPLTPDAVRERLAGLGWFDARRLPRILQGELPRDIPLHPPTEREAIAVPRRFWDFLEAWDAWERESANGRPRGRVLRKRSRRLGKDVPERFVLGTREELVAFGGPEVEEFHRDVLGKLEAFRDLPAGAAMGRDATLLKEIAKRSPDETVRLAALLPQLRQGMGKGGFLRRLPLMGVDTKFLEDRLDLVLRLVNANEGLELGNGAELLEWLDCRLPPRGDVLCLALCPELRAHYGNVGRIKVGVEDFMAAAPPARAVLVVENVQCADAIPDMDGTLAVLGLGKNLVPLEAPWLADVRVGYWGDLDTHGLGMLADARTKRPGLEAVMMDAETYDAFPDLRADEPTRFPMPPAGLTPAERELFRRLEGPDARLEQERLSRDHVRRRLLAWRRGEATSPN